MVMFSLELQGLVNWRQHGRECLLDYLELNFLWRNQHGRQSLLNYM